MLDEKEVTLVLTRGEARVLKHLLAMASDEFSNHGCNDVLTSEAAGVSPEVGALVGKALNKRMADTLSDYDPDLAAEIANHPGEYLKDVRLFEHFMVLVDRALLGESDV